MIPRANQRIFNSVFLILLGGIIFFGSRSRLAHAQENQAEKAQSQKQYAAFIHGFNFGGGSCNRENRGRRWEEGGAPASWSSYSGPVDGYELLKYCRGKLYRSTNIVLRRLADQMKSRGKNARWVLVGHSQGGIVARLLHEYIRKNTSLDVDGVMALASPMQGARIAEVAFGKYDGYKNIKPIVDDLFNDIVDGPVTELETSLANILTFGVVGSVAKWKIQNRKDKLDNSVDDFINGSTVRSNAKKFISPDGEMIEDINNSKNPDNYVSYLGSERSPAAVRLMSGKNINEGLSTPDAGFWATLGWGALGAAGNPGVFSLIMSAEDRKVSPGDEAAAVNVFEDVKNVYSSNAEYYKYRRWFPPDPRAHACFQAWRRGRDALNSINERHTRLIDAYTLVKREKQVTVCEDNSKSRGKAASDLFAPPSASRYVDQYLEPPPDETGEDDGRGTDCHYEMETYYKSVPNKNDGFLGTAYTTWHENGRSRFSEPHLNSHSILYSDNETGTYKRGGTGFNHAEMVYNKRRYSSSNDPRLPDNAFGEGDRNPSMRDAEDWVATEVFGLQ